MQHFDVIVIGGGASGLMCAATAGRRGRSVLVIDSSNKMGKKILMSGGGRCNFTNMDVSNDCYLSSNTHFFKSALKRYSQWDFLDLVSRYNIPWHERQHGELFCDDSARDILEMLLAECSDAGVKLQTHCSVGKVQHNGDVFMLASDKGGFSCQSLVVATGGLSIPTMGATGFGYDLAQQFGHRCIERRAGLVPFMFSDSFKALSERLSGLAVDVELSCGDISFRENVLFTHRGLSGPAALQLSNYWLPGQVIAVNLLPDDDVHELLLELKVNHSRAVLRNALVGKLSKGLLLDLEALFWPEYAARALAEIPDAVLISVADNLSAWHLKPSGTEGYRTAEVTLGGVDVDQLSSKTLESKLQTGLYFIGEVIDVTGHLGGYNFHWAWASGSAAGQFV